jgi:diaminohydroxyphosphoribosylaminopyrimidine deaminase/5-amino-6-(5-phosphoribosylamino)uracil reductase
MESSDLDHWHMTRALELAARGEGSVEPNPMVGCVVARGAEVIGEGFHRRFGGPHAEVEALAVAGPRARGATLYVTLEPCCHTGKTPPCTEAVLAAGVARVVIAQLDPFPAVAGSGIARLKEAGVAVDVGPGQEQARRLNAPYLKLVTTGRPWVIAKWAMTLDGKLATQAGDSRWISSEASRRIVHQVRGRVDAIVVGRGTADADDPLLTARPSGPRVATRIVLDRRASLSPGSQLARTARETPVLVVVGAEAAEPACQQLREAGCEVLAVAGGTREEQWRELLAELGARRMTNVLVEGGGTVLGALFDARLVDEVHVFIAPKIVGGGNAATPVGGKGPELMSQALMLRDVEWRKVDEDLYLRGRVQI